MWDRVFGLHGLLRQYGKTVILATHAAHYIRYADHVIVMGDNSILQQGTFDQLNMQAGYVQDLLLSEQRERERSQHVDNDADISTKPVTVSAAEAAAVARANDLSRRTGDTSLYSYYLKSVNLRDCIIYLSLASAFTFAHYFPQVWLKWWAESETSNPGAKTRMYFGVYAMFGVIGLALLGICFW